jgi:hypothetical protein
MQLSDPSLQSSDEWIKGSVRRLDAKASMPVMLRSVAMSNKYILFLQNMIDAADFNLAKVLASYCFKYIRANSKP